jgi:hypothetical protein
MSEFKQVVQDGTKKVVKWTKRLLWIALAVVILSGLGYIGYCNYTYSEGSRTGNLMKISRKGMVFKTYEGQLNAGGMPIGPSLSTAGTIWDFSAKNRSEYQQMQDMEGTYVKLYYKQKIKAMPWQGKTDYIVYKAEKIAAPGSNQ